jgi:hypothetical protein
MVRGEFCGEAHRTNGRRHNAGIRRVLRTKTTEFAIPYEADTLPIDSNLSLSFFQQCENINHPISFRSGFLLVRGSIVESPLLPP